ncbi:hypothetical protein BDQ17DRAFT_1330048 [Cyathus striatus]|nr:hypothetical protein BDQ17DRAFT_1330048 [Cyathus striatus]
MQEDGFRSLEIHRDDDDKPLGVQQCGIGLFISPTNISASTHHQQHNKQVQWAASSQQSQIPTVREHPAGFTSAITIATNARHASYGTSPYPRLGMTSSPNTRVSTPHPQKHPQRPAPRAHSRYVHGRHVDHDAGVLHVLMKYCGGGDISTIFEQTTRHYSVGVTALPSSWAWKGCQRWWGRMGQTRGMRSIWLHLRGIWLDRLVWRYGVLRWSRFIQLDGNGDDVQRQWPAHLTLTQTLKSTTQHTFSLLHSIVQTFSGIKRMLEATFKATHSPFFETPHNHECSLCFCGAAPCSRLGAIWGRLQ